MSADRILLTNDDGVDAAGLRALYDALAEEYAVTVVAPADDQSSVGRRLSDDVAVDDHGLGYVVDGTPVDCVVAGLDELVPDADVVVAGCNEGANLGAYTLGRSGTVSAAVEAAFFGVPAVATSMYVPGGDDWWKRSFESADFAHAARATEFLVDGAVDAGVFERADYLNVNAPIADEERAPLRVTTPSTWYGMRAERNGDGRVGFSDPIWDLMNDGDLPDPVGADRRAVVDGEVSVSPLSVPHAAEPDAGLDKLVDAYEAAVRS
ncbi:5'/3'-nucleotidase SurE [Halorubrum sp. BOL3-1]|uniref:5'/3'-nucleotidase SurE n=1 Tax=Halorubrum sp. BOL3-1 TaxID=2497325 RepID=UPI001004F6AD|nr:5'/3'-nucleotidase SurE [Halorubrum sp. BOL3-1]QAU11842.1 5'/3'-nucleotidase SurE [Halorubrum sp. BOL3-1]